MGIDTVRISPYGVGLGFGGSFCANDDMPYTVSKTTANTIRDNIIIETSVSLN